MVVLSTNFLTAVNFARFVHDGYRTSTTFTVMNTPIAAGMPIVTWRHFSMAERFFFGIYSLRIIVFGTCNICSCLSGASYMHISTPLKIHPSTSFLVSHRSSQFSTFVSDIGSGLPYFVADGGGKTVFSMEYCPL